ncbi:hypothetical protein AB6A40_008036 [Gnathostoma spinigerum]|uniref:Coiled-coil domain-containing protein 86 n=1 Tax=Gnathostoma spinigerum TaxID=75299 RepID=A0ABD6EQ80_9BILA
MEVDEPIAVCSVSEEKPKSDEKVSVRGLSKSGRWWKNPRVERHSKIAKDKPLKSSWEKKMKEKQNHSNIKKMQQEIREKLAAEKAAKIEARKEHERRREENAKKAEIVQVIRNTNKLKRAKKKQLRMITKADALALPKKWQMSLKSQTESHLDQGCPETETEKDSQSGKEAFIRYRQELDDRYDRYERIVKVSRDITIESKRIIFQLHRTTIDKGESSAILDNAYKRIDELRDKMWRKIAVELISQDHCMYTQSYCFGLQEFVEAWSFYKFLAFKKLLTFKEVCDGLCFRDGDADIHVNVPAVEYLCGLSDLGGELMRYATNQATAGNFEECAVVANFMRLMYAEFISVNMQFNWAKDWSFKLQTLRESVVKVENLLFKRVLRLSDQASGGRTLVSGQSR